MLPLGATATLCIVANRFELWPGLMFETFRQITAEPVARTTTNEQVQGLLWQAPLDQGRLADEGRGHPMSARGRRWRRSSPEPAWSVWRRAKAI